MAKTDQNFLLFRSGFGQGDLDTLVAEHDEHLPQYYVGHDRYVDRALSREGKATFFVGPKGAGKSAVLQMVRTERRARGDGARIIDVSPDDLAFNALVNINVQTPLLSEAGNNMWLFTALWDFVLSVEVLRREEPSSAGLLGLLDKLLGDRFVTEKSKLLSLSLSDDGTATSMTDKMLALVRAVEMEGGYGEARAKVKIDTATDPRRGTEDLKLLQLINNIAKQLPNKVRNEYSVLIDDLDLHWVGTDLQNHFLGAMFLSIRKLSREGKIRFAVSLRKNIYKAIHLEERDKFSDMVVDVVWTKQDVQAMVSKRLAFVFNIAEGKVFENMFFPEAFEKIWDATSGIPREVIRLSTLCVRQAIQGGSKSVRATDFEQAVVDFSDERIDDLGSQFRTQHPGLAIVLKSFRGRPKEFGADVVSEVAFTVYERTADADRKERYGWAIQGVEQPLGLARILLQTGALLFKEHRRAKARPPRDEDLDVLNAENWFAIHPMYAASLDLK